jgi:hypothetical protein
MENSALGRLLWVLVAPGRTFRALAERPTFLVVMLLLGLLSALVAAIMTLQVDLGDAIRESLAEQGQTLPDAQLENFERIGRWVSPVGAFLGSLGIYALAALVFLGVFRILGSTMGYRASLAVTVHAFAPGAVAALLSLVVLMLREKLSMEEIQQGRLLLSNLAAFGSSDTSPPLMALLKAVDVFSLWTVVLLVLGYGIVARVSRNAALATVLLAWGVVVAGSVGLAALQAGVH